jgi:hypothetical protein
MDLASFTTVPELDAAIDRIEKRHLKVEDPRFGSVDVSRPAELLEYIHRQTVEHVGNLVSGAARLPRWVVVHDVDDGLVLHNWNRAQEQRRERDLLRDGITLGIPLSQLGAPLGLGSRIRSADGNRRQGVQDRLDRLEALLKFDRPDASITRAARRVARETAERKAAGEHDPQTAWLHANASWISGVAAQLLALEPFADDAAAELLVEVRHDWRDGEWTPGSLVWMSMAAQALRVSSFVDKSNTVRYVADLGATHRAHRTIKAVEDLRAAFTQLSS